MSTSARGLSLLLCFVLLAMCPCNAQQHPVVPISGAESPKGCLFPFQDSRGRLWLAGCETGHEGVYVFDGLRFLSAEGDMDGAGVGGMVEDTSGGIWLAANKGLFRVSGGKLAKVFDGIALAGITQIAPDVFLLAMRRRAGTTLTGVDALRLSRSGSEWRLDSVLKDVGEIKFRLDSRGNVLYGCDDGFCELPASAIVQWKQGQQLKILSHKLGTGQRYMRSTAVVLRDRYGCVWLRDPSTVTYQCRADGPASRLASPEIGSGVALLYELNDGSILIPSFAKITIGRPGRMEVIPITTHGPTIPLREGGLLAIGLNGLIYLPRHLGVEYWNESDGLGGNTWTVFRRSQRMYALADETAYVLDEDRKRWSFLKGSVESMTPGKDDTILIASGGAVRQIAQTGRVLKSSRSAGLSNVFRLRDDSIWATGDMTYKIEDNGRELALSEPAKGLANVSRIDGGPEGNAWACGENGLSRLGPDGWKPAPPEIANLGCRLLTSDANGRIWLWSGQTYRIDQHSNSPLQIRAIPQEDRDSLSNFVAVDTRGRIWRGTANALYVADQQVSQGSWLRLGQTDGLPTFDTNKYSFFEDRDGSVWYGADNDVIHLTAPDDLLHPTFAPEVFIMGFTVDGGKLHLDPAQNRFPGAMAITAHLGSLQFDRRNALHLRYRLLPEQDAWTATNNFDFSLGKIRWGRHTLQTQAQLIDGPWSPIVEQSFSVDWPVWLSWPLLLIYGVTGTGVGAGVSHWRQKRKLERELSLPDLSAWRMSALSPETESLVGTRVDGRYEIGHVLSVGGFATVVRARDLDNDGELCAVKIFRYEFGNRAWIRHRFEQEISALEQLSHPNIVRITGHGSIETGAPYLVMEFIHGLTLREHLDKGAVARAQIGLFLRQIAGALHSLHERAIYHRDLKPENLMIRTSDRYEPEIVLIDFSIAIVKSRDQTFHGISRVAGTLEYMAPEQVIGFADASTDIYALAKIVMEMLTGLRWNDLFPEAALDLPEQIRVYFERKTIVLRTDSVDHIVAAMAFDPAGRPKDVVEFVRPIIRDLEQTQ